MNTKLNKNQRRTRVVVGQYQEIENLRSVNAALLEALEDAAFALSAKPEYEKIYFKVRTAIAKAKAASTHLIVRSSEV